MKRGCLISFVFLAALLVGFELVARTGWIAALRPEVLDPLGDQIREKANVAPHPYLAYAPKPNFVQTETPKGPQVIHHNSLGFRGRETTYAKPPGTFRIVTIGGSSCYGQSESRDEAVWSVRLEHYLNEAGLARKVEVINGGCRGYSTFEMLINLELRLVDFEPDLLITYESINDMRCALYPGCVNDNTHWRAVWPVVEKSSADELLESSRLFMTWRRYGTEWLAKQKDLGTYMIVDYGKYHSSLYAGDYGQPTDAERGFANFRRNLKSIVSVAREHGAKVLLSTQAMRFSDIEGAQSYEAQKAGLLRCRDILREVASSEGVPLADTAKHVEDALAAELAAGQNPDDLFQHEVHPTDKGSDLIGRFLADRILELELVPAN
ncbi:MAG: SGNH/GDSL hydrolase family protein [Planctomycetes bacterium]|nr:SGNH/GDSL hydrolase family protein [Planctomycetota bacterium]